MADPEGLNQVGLEPKGGPCCCGQYKSITAPLGQNDTLHEPLGPADNFCGPVLHHTLRDVLEANRVLRWYGNQLRTACNEILKDHKCWDSTLEQPCAICQKLDDCANEWPKDQLKHLEDPFVRGEREFKEQDCNNCLGCDNCSAPHEQR